MQQTPPLENGRRFLARKYVNHQSLFNCYKRSAAWQEQKYLYNKTTVGLVERGYRMTRRTIKTSNWKYHYHFCKVICWKDMIKQVYRISQMLWAYQRWIFHHFSSKEDILMRLWKAVWADNRNGQKWLDEMHGLTAKEKLRGLIRRNLMDEKIIKESVACHDLKWRSVYVS